MLEKMVSEVEQTMGREVEQDARKSPLNVELGSEATRLIRMQDLNPFATPVLRVLPRSAKREVQDGC